jgi:hypothetical protein
VTSPTPGVLPYWQLCGEATAAIARDDAAALSAERRLQVAHQLVGVDDGARGDTKVGKRGGLPVTFTSAGGDGEPAAIRMVDLEKKFYMGAAELAERILSRSDKSDRGHGCGV